MTKTARLIPGWTYWTTGTGTRHEIRHRRCTTCGNPETYFPDQPPRTPCRFYHHPKATREYTGGTPST